MANHCININHPIVVGYASKLNISSALVAAKIGVWQNKNNSNIIPSIEELQGKIVTDLAIQDNLNSNLKGQKTNKANFISENTKKVLDFLESNLGLINHNLRIYDTQEEYDEITKGTKFENSGGVYAVDDETGEVIIGINPREKDAESWVHELSHAFLEVILNNPQTKEEKNFVSLVNSLYKEFKQMKWADVLYDGYQYNDISEFLIHALTNTETQNFINSNKKTKSIWSKIIDTIKSLFGIKSQTQFDELFKATKSAILSSDYKNMKNRILDYSNKNKGQRYRLTNEQEEAKTIKSGVQELFESNPELANAVYSKILTNSGLSAENLLSLLLKDNLIEKQCS